MEETDVVEEPDAVEEVDDVGVGDEVVKAVVTRVVELVCGEVELDVEVVEPVALVEVVDFVLVEMAVLEVVVVGCDIVVMGAEEENNPEVPTDPMTTPESPGTLLGWKIVAAKPVVLVCPEMGVKLKDAPDGV